MNWYLDVLKNKYALFSGRASRQEFWMFALINFLIAIAIGVVEGIIGTGGIVGLIYNLAILVPSIAVGVRRMHDTNRSGWWLLINLIPLIGFIIYIVFAVQDSDAGDNSYGANPKVAA